MPAPAVGGFIGGWMAGEQHQQEMAVNELAYKEEALKYQSAQDEMYLKKQMAETASTLLQQHQDKGQDRPQSIIDTSYSMAELAMSNGNPVLGMNIMNETAGTQEKVASTRIKVNEASIKNMEILYQDLAAVNDEASWKGLWTRYAINHPEAANDPRIQSMVQEQLTSPYDPQWVEHLRNTTTSQLDKARIEQVQAQTALTQSRIKTEDYRRNKYLPSVIAANEARAKHLEKVGATDAPLKPEEVRAATDYIGSQYNIEVNKEAARAKGRDLARRTRKHIAAGEAPAVAMKNAFDEAVASGAFAGFRPGRRGPGSFEKPMVPEQGKPFVTGMWYTGAPGTKLAGKRVLYDGGQFLSEEEVAQRAGQYESGEEVDEPDNYEGEK